MTDQERYEQERMQNFEEARRAAEEQIMQDNAGVAPEGDGAAAPAVPAAAPAVPAAPTAPADGNGQPGQAVPPQQPEPSAEAYANEAAQQARLAMQNQQMQQALIQMQNQNRQLQETIAEMNRRNQEVAEEEVLTPPVLDMTNMWTEDENVVRQKQQEYAQQMAEYTRKQMMKELSPLMNYARQGMQEKEIRHFAEILSDTPEFSGIMGMTPALERIIANNPTLANSNAPMEDKLITAYAIAKGGEAIQKGQEPPKQPGVEDFMKMYAENPELQRRVEAIRAAQAAQNRANVPPMSASAGAFNAELSAPEEPKNFDDAMEMLRAKLGI